MTVDLLVTTDAPTPVPQVRLDLDLLKKTVAEGTTDDEFKLFVKVCERTGLDPFARQIYAIVPRRKNGNDWVRDYGKPVRTQTSIDGYRLIAERTGKYAGRLGPYWCGEDGAWLMDAEGRPLPWLADKPPSASMVGILRHGFTEPLLHAIARFKSYVQTNYQGERTGQWVKGEDLMIGKCLPGRAKLSTDRGLLTIREIVKGHLPVKVRSIDLETGLEVWQPVVSWYLNPPTNQWVRLWAPSGNRGRQVSRVSHDHPVWTPDGWVKAGELGVGDLVAVTSPTISAAQDQVIRGGLLGDGTLSGRKSPASMPHYAEAHAVAQRSYLLWKAQALTNLGSLLNETTKGDGTGKRHDVVTMRTRAVPALLPYRSLAPASLLQGLDDLGLAVWLMDDGAIKATGGT